MRTRLGRRAARGVTGLLLAAGLAGPSVAQTASAPAPNETAPAETVSLGSLTDAQPELDVLNDPDQGQPQALAPEPRDVLFPALGLPYERERLAFRKRLFDRYGITYALSYQQLTQYATETLPITRQDWAIGGWAATSLTWTPLDRGGKWEGTLVFRGGWRGPLGDNPWPAPFGPAYLGMAWSNFEFTSWKSRYAVEDLFWEQKLGPEFSFRVGNQGPQATINSFRFKDARTGFSASPLAFSETIPYPAFGAGLSFRWRPSRIDGLFVNGVLNDMNGNPGQGSLNWSHLNQNQLFEGLEIGKRWNRADGEYDQLAVDVFYAGTRSIFNPMTSPNKPGGGFKVLGEKQFGRFVTFAAYTYNTAKGGGISTTFSGNTAVAGAALLRPFGIRGEVALAGMWTQPFKNIFPGSGQRDQYGLETYWNLAVTPNVTLTPGIQLLADPSFNPRASFVAIPSIKFRLAL